MSSVTYKHIQQVLRTLELQDTIVCIHSSLKSFGKLEGGPKTLLDAFLDKGNTVLVPTFSYDYEVPPPENMRPERNGYDYDAIPIHSEDDLLPYTPKSDFIVRDMGAIPKAVLSYKQHIRGNHPLNSFSAIGPKAEELIEGQTPLDVYAPFEVMYQNGGYVILMGVTLVRATAIHYAEQRIGKNLFVRWAKDPQGNIQPVKVGSCSDGFDRLLPMVKPFEKTLTVGKSLWRIYDSKTFVNAVAEEIQRNPEITHCGDPKCDRCRDMVAGGCIER